MDKLQCIRLFARLAVLESFSATAEEFGLTQSSVSKAIARLETGLGVRLLHRSTRSQSLTEAGERYLAHCLPMLEALDETESSLQLGSQALRGVLRITAPVPFGSRFIAPALAAFQNHHPQLQVRLDLSDESAAMAGSRYDLAIRLGDPGSEATVVRTLGHSQFRLVAAPDYLEQTHPIHSTDDLPGHRLLAFSREPNPTWCFTHEDGQERQIALKSGFHCNSLSGLHATALASQGIAALPVWQIAADLDQGRLCELLPEWHLPDYPLVAVYPSLRQIPSRVRRVVSYLHDHLRHEDSLQML